MRHWCKHQGLTAAFYIELASSLFKVLQDGTCLSHQHYIFDFWQLTYVSLQLLMQNRTRKWHFPLNFQNGINWTGAFLLNLRYGKNWTDAFFKAFGSSEALISVLCKNACVYDNISNSFQSKMLYIVLTFKWSCLDTNLWICNLCICEKTCQQNTNFW